VVLIETAGVTAALMFTVTALLVAVGEVTQDELLVITTDTTSLFARVVEVNVEPVAPGTLLPLTSHW
jgi:hypothetical protein